MKNILQNNSIWLLTNFLVLFIALILVSGLVPIVIYILTGRARTSSWVTRYMIIMEGQKALQFVTFQLSLDVGFIILILAFLFESSYWWVGAVIMIISVPFMINATIGARQDTRKNSLYDIKELWRH